MESYQVHHWFVCNFLVFWFLGVYFYRMLIDWTLHWVCEANESFEKLASMSLIGNLSVYLTTKYNLGGVFLVNIINIWFGSCNFLSIPGAFVSDAYLGRFWTLLLGSIASFLVNLPSHLFISSRHVSRRVKAR